MTMRRFGIALAATLAVGALAARGRAEDPPAGGADPMAAYMKMHEPGPAQAQLEKLEGAWSATTRFFGPTGEMMDEGKGSSENAMILGGRHLETWYSGSMMGMPFEGRGLLSHDNFRKVWQMSWIDSVGSNQGTWEGASTSDLKTIVVTGSEATPFGTFDARWTFKIESDDKYTMVSEKSPPGKNTWMKDMEIIYTRVVETDEPEAPEGGDEAPDEGGMR
ncbi:MAG: DUF1579 family protein [Planctomycetes bacterium]|nr:DUF1579 family protein [Planctomycetota bacterium]MCB9829357.1 DUF1579 family protein [Planctomycetota bacterium]